MGDVASSLFRETKPPEPGLLDREPDWRKAWWGMPDFEAGDCRPHRKVVVNFATAADMKAFAKLTGLTVGPRTDTVWYPAQPKLGGAWYFDGPETSTKYPVCIPSKGRAAIQKTGLALDRMGVEYKFFVEETEYDAYCDRHNEDTDLSLRLLKDGYCTVLFNAFLMNKEATSYGDGKRTGMAGGNTDTVYAGNDHRREFAESLQRQHPDVVKVVWKYHRWHHEVDYSRFRRNRLRLRPGVVPTAEGDEYGMELIGPKAGDAEK